MHGSACRAYNIGLSLSPPPVQASPATPRSLVGDSLRRRTARTMGAASMRSCVARVRRSQ